MCGHGLIRKVSVPGMRALACPELVVRPVANMIRCERATISFSSAMSFVLILIGSCKLFADQTLKLHTTKTQHLWLLIRPLHLIGPVVARYPAALFGFLRDKTIFEGGTQCPHGNLLALSGLHRHPVELGLMFGADGGQNGFLHADPDNHDAVVLQV